MLVLLAFLRNGVDGYNDDCLLLRMGLIAPRGKQLKTSLPSFVSMLTPFSLNGLVRGGSMVSFLSSVFQLSYPVPSDNYSILHFKPGSFTFNNIYLCHIDATKVSLCCRNLFLCLSLFWFFFRSIIYLANLNGLNILICL